MSGRTHRYQTSLEWLGNHGTGTSGYRDYGRTHVVRSGAKPPIAGSSDAVFRGEADRFVVRRRRGRRPAAARARYFV